MPRAWGVAGGNKDALDSGGGGGGDDDDEEPKDFMGKAAKWWDNPENQVSFVQTRSWKPKRGGAVVVVVTLITRDV